MGSAPLRPLPDLFIDRRNLHAISGTDEKRSSLGKSRHRRLVERRRRHGAEARTSRTVRSPGHHSLPAAGLERYHYLRLPRICHPELEPMASRDRGRPLLARHALSCLAAPALSKRDLAWFCPARGKLPLFGSPRLLALSISGLPRTKTWLTRRSWRGESGVRSPRSHSSARRPKQKSMNSPGSEKGSFTRVH